MKCNYFKNVIIFIRKKIVLFFLVILLFVFFWQIIPGEFKIYLGNGYYIMYNHNSLLYMEGSRDLGSNLIKCNSNEKFIIAESQPEELVKTENGENIVSKLKEYYDTSKYRKYFIIVNEFKNDSISNSQVYYTRIIETDKKEEYLKLRKKFNIPDSLQLLTISEFALKQKKINLKYDY